MGEKLRNYQVLDVLCGGTFYKVRHKVTNNIFAWKAFDCSSYSREQIQNIVNEVKTLKTISESSSESLLQYYDSILHAPSKTLYLVVEHCSWRSVQDLAELCLESDRHVAEGFLWRLLYEMCRALRAVWGVPLALLRPAVEPARVLVRAGRLRVDLFSVRDPEPAPDLVRQAGGAARLLLTSQHGQDLHDVLRFLGDDRNEHLRPDAVLYHPTVLANLETMAQNDLCNDIFIPNSSVNQVNKCDSEKAVEVRKSRSSSEDLCDSPAYANVCKPAICESEEPGRASLLPTIAALALELPGFVPRCRLPISNNSPRRVTERALGRQWMSRLVALRQREASLNKREREILSKEIVSSPFVPESSADGITLPGLVQDVRVPRRPRRTSVRRRPRKSCYDECDSSLSADPGDSVEITATRLTRDNMPRRTIFPEVTSKKVHFSSSNPFTESDESVTLTFYELEGDGGPVRDLAEISKFKYMDVSKSSEKRAGPHQWHSPSKQAKTRAFTDITNHNLRKTPSKSSLTSKGSSTSVRCSLAPEPPQTELKKSKSRKSLLSFKTPFKFMSSSKV